MGKILSGVVAGIFVGALTVEIMNRRKKQALTRKCRKLWNMVDNTLNRIAAVF
jgi:uncharacterized membrane-anchored protein YhcB (DUF1043 family)